MIVGTQGVQHIQQFLLRRQQAKHQLTQRQIDCLYYLTKGMTIRKIAGVLLLSPRTVEHYIEAIKLKLNCISREELVEKAFSFKIVYLSDV